MNRRYGPYGCDSRSFFKVDLVVRNQIASSVPCRLYYRDGKRRFIKYVRSSETSFDILIRYAHWFPHPETWERSGGPSENLFATVHREFGGELVSREQGFIIPYVQQDGRHDRKVIIPYTVADPQACESHTMNGICTTSSDGITNDVILQHLDGDNATGNLRAVRKDQGVKHPSMSGDEYNSDKYRFDLVVSLWRRRVEEPHGRDCIRIDEFRLRCVDHDEFLAGLRRVLAIEDARKIYESERDDERLRMSQAQRTTSRRNEENTTTGSIRPTMTNVSQVLEHMRTGLRESPELQSQISQSFGASTTLPL